jgi:hypothetical protein
LDAETGDLEVAAKQCSAGLSFVPSACWAELVLMTSACCAELSVLGSPASRACVLMVVGITPWMVAVPGAPALDWSASATWLSGDWSVSSLSTDFSANQLLPDTT